MGFAKCAILALVLTISSSIAEVPHDAATHTAFAQAPDVINTATSMSETNWPAVNTVLLAVVAMSIIARQRLTQPTTTGLNPHSIEAFPDNHPLQQARLELTAPLGHSS